MAVRNQRNPRDVTGTLSDQQAEAHREQLAARESQLTTVTGVMKPPEGEGLVDYTSQAGDSAAETVAAPGELKVGKATVKEQTVKLRVNTDMPNITINGDYYDFNRGVDYVVPDWVARLMEEKGVVWH